MDGHEHEPHGGQAPEAAARQATPGEVTRPSAPWESPEERETVDEQPAPRIYVASLSDYNAGRLHGAWIDAAQDVDGLHDDISRMLAESPNFHAEEWAIHDHDGFAPLDLSEYESLEFISDVATGIVEHGEAFAAFAEVAERDPDRFHLYEQMYRGTWDSVEAYAEQLLNDLGVEEQLAQLPEWIRPYVSLDVSSLAVELVANGFVTTVPASDGRVHVFDFE